MSRLSRIGLLIVACAWHGTEPAQSADLVWSVSEVNAAEEKWAAWVDMPLKIEGRVTLVTRGYFRLSKCDFVFRVTEDQRKIADSVRNVEVSGRLKQESDSKTYYIAVERVKPVGSDIEHVHNRELKLKNTTKPSDWYDLAEWAESRGKFYEDNDLLAEGRRAWSKGLELERKSLAAHDVDGRLAIVERLRERKAASLLQAELIHEAARLKWQQAKGDIQRRKQFIDWLKETCPESSEPLESIPAELSRNYEAHPLETFRQADESTRAWLPRLLLIQAELGSILPAAKADGSNAAETAEELKRLVPERSDLIDKYREDDFQWRLKSVAKATRPEVLRLAEELKARDQADAAKDVLTNWIRRQEQRLRKDGPIGLMQLADDHLQILQDEPAAVKLLAEAHELDPSFEDAGERLKQLGYRWAQNKWVKADSPNTPANHDTHANQLAVGMPADAVLALLGEPSGKTRIITGSTVLEVWAFGRRGRPRLLIHLQQAPGKNEPKVTRFLTEGGR